MKLTCYLIMNMTVPMSIFKELSVEDVVVSRLSGYMKNKLFRYIDDDKIY